MRLMIFTLKKKKKGMNAKKKGKERLKIEREAHSALPYLPYSIFSTIPIATVFFSTGIENSSVSY